MEQFSPIKRSKDGQPVRYLIVDDSVFARKNLGRIIETFGGQIAGEAGDGLTAITEYERIKPDIVLMDITMPQMEGIEAAEKIVQQNPDARVVMVSSVGYQENIVAAFILLALNCLKPTIWCGKRCANSPTRSLATPWPH